MLEFFRLAKMFLRIGVMNEMAYRANFWIQTFESLLSMATALATIAIVFNRTDGLGGWQQAELVSLLGVYFLALGTINLVVSPSLGRFMGEVVDGLLDFTLIKPADAQLLVSISEFRIWKILDIILGLIVLSMGLAAKTEATSLASVVIFGIN